MDNNNKELVSKEKLHLLTYQWLSPFINKCEDLGGDWNHFSNLNGFGWDLCSSVRKCGIGARLCENQWVIYNDTCDTYANIKIFDDHIEFDEDSEFTDFTRDEMYSLYKFLKERIFDIKIDFVVYKEKNEDENVKNEDENVKNNDKLISQEELCSLVGEHVLPIISRRCGFIISGNDGNLVQCDNVDFMWTFRNSVGVWQHAGFACLINDHWEIYNGNYQEENVNIRIFDDHMEFIEDSEFASYEKEEMFSLYTFLKERILDNIEKENKEENK